MRSLGDNIHAMGLKFGIYSSPGLSPAGGTPGHTDLSLMMPSRLPTGGLIT